MTSRATVTRHRGRGSLSQLEAAQPFDVNLELGHGDTAAATPGPGRRVTGSLAQCHGSLTCMARAWHAASGPALAPGGAGHLQSS